MYYCIQYLDSIRGQHDWEYNVDLIQIIVYYFLISRLNILLINFQWNVTAVNKQCHCCTLRCMLIEMNLKSTCIIKNVLFNHYFILSKLSLFGNLNHFQNLCGYEICNNKRKPQTNVIRTYGFLLHYTALNIG